MIQDKRFDLAKRIPKLESKLGIEKGFFDNLAEESDWAFIIKMHALIEAATSDLLTSYLKYEALNDTFSYMELSNKKSGKMAFVKALGLLGDAERRFISSLSELRNKLVHNISNVNYHLHVEVENMDTNQLNQFIKKFNTLSTELDDNVRNLFRHDPIQALWYGGMSVLGLIYLKQDGSI